MGQNGISLHLKTAKGHRNDTEKFDIPPNIKPFHINKVPEDLEILSKHKARGGLHWGGTCLHVSMANMHGMWQFQQTPSGHEQST